MRSFTLIVGKLLESIVVLILATMSILVFLNVVLRYGFNSGISITEEVARYLFVWLTFLAAVLAFSDNQHVNVTLLTDKLSAKGREILGLFTDAIMLFCCYLMVQGSWVQFVLNLNNLAPISGLPQGITFLASVVASSLIGILLLARLAIRLGHLFKGESL